MIVKLNRNDLVKTKGDIELPDDLKGYQLLDTQSNKLTQTLIECITTKSPSGLFSKEGEEDERTQN